jgi:hypothetical protein
MHTITINNIKISTPSEWNELTEKQFSIMAKLLTMPLPIMDFKTKLFLYISNIKVHIKKEIEKEYQKPWFLLSIGKKKFLMDPEDLSFCANTLDFLFKKEKRKDGTENTLLYSKLIKNLLPSFTHNKKTFYGPDDALTNIIFLEYMYAEPAFINFCNTKNNKYLIELVSILYRPEILGYNPKAIEYNGDRREPFNAFLVSSRAEFLADLPEDICQKIYLFYSGTRNHIQEIFPEIFTGGGSTKKQNAFRGMMKMVNALAQSDVTKNEKIRQTYLYEVLETLNELALQNIEMKEKFDKVKKK